MNKLRVGILGATGMVGQRFVALLEEHPWFEIRAVAASPRSAGLPYGDAVAARWSMTGPVPERVAGLTVRAVREDLAAIGREVDLVFCALDLGKEEIRALEIDYATAGIPVISNNSAHRWSTDVPIIMPEVNPDHLKLIDHQRRARGWTSGLIAVKPNCSLQSYTSILTALGDFEPTDVAVTSLQAISGAGKTFATWPEMQDNVIPFIPGEEEKSEREPLKIWGGLHDGAIQNAALPRITATCIRVPASDGHLAAVSVRFKKHPTGEQILSAIATFRPLAGLRLPSAPEQPIRYLPEPDRPQVRLDRDYSRGMGITMGRLREDEQFSGWRFIALVHNTVRGAAGGAILTAELLFAKGYIAR